MGIIRNNKNRNIRLEVITTDIADLAMMGFGSISNCRSVYDALAEEYRDVKLSIISSKSDLEGLVSRKPDLVFTGIKYVIFSDNPITKGMKEKVWISDFLDKNGINYTGSSKKAIELDFDKKLAKAKMQCCGVDTAEYFVSTPGLYQCEEKLPVKFPLFIKPLYESDSKGVDHESNVADFLGYQRKVSSIYSEFRQPAMVESFLAGREFTVAILGSDSYGAPNVMPVEIVVDVNSQTGGILGYETKKTNQERLIPIDDKETYKTVTALAKKALVALGARDFGRIDIKMDEQGRPFFLEANLLPGMNMENSYFPQACYINNGDTYQQIVHRIAEIALNR